MEIAPTLVDFMFAMNTQSCFHWLSSLILPDAPHLGMMNPNATAALP
jgi:hypothetical protein